MRRIDYSFAEWIPMGSHFLWHIFSGIGAFYLAKYLYLIRKDELEMKPLWRLLSLFLAFYGLYQNL